MPDNNFSTKKVNTLFTGLAPVYDLLNRICTFGADHTWRKHLVNSLPEVLGAQEQLLDLGAGTMEVSVILARRYPRARVLAMDVCLPMLRKGHGKLQNLSVHPISADARNIPLPCASTSAVALAFGLRNMAPRALVFQEILRILKPGGTCAILEFGSVHDRACGGIYNFYLAHILPLVGVVLSRKLSSHNYLVKAVKSFPSATALLEEMDHAGFTNTSFKKFTAGCITLHIGQKTL